MMRDWVDAGDEQRVRVRETASLFAEPGNGHRVCRQLRVRQHAAEALRIRQSPVQIHCMDRGSGAVFHVLRLVHHEIAGDLIDRPIAELDRDTCAPMAGRPG